MTGFRAIADPDAAREYRAQGWWGDRTLVDQVRDNVATRPDGPAFVDDVGTLTWSQYLAAATNLAARLRTDAGLQPGERVAVLLPDAAVVHAVYLACELAGLTVVGIGPRAGDRELQHLLGKTGAAALVTSTAHRGRADLRTIVVDELDTTPVPFDDGDRMGPDDLFLVNSTSGTTGLPKCVVHTQNRWMYFHQQAAAGGRLHADDVFLSAVPAPFGFGIWTAHFTPTLLGAPVVVAERFNAGRVLELIERHRVTVLACVSTQFVMLLNDPSLDDRDLTSLRAMYTGGEAVPYARAKAFEARTGGAVLQFFGSNETGLLSGTTLDDPLERRISTAGRICPDMRVRLYDGDVDVTASGRGQPAGRGPATCVGYLDDDAANAQLFTSDGWMLMGDICTLDADGWLTVVGRTSDIIIRGGKNISAAQVEDEVGSHPAVALAAAVAQPDPIFGERVCAYVELHPGQTLVLDDLLRHLEGRGTSKELWPESLVVLDQLPRSSGGKVAKGDLRADLERRTAKTEEQP